MRCRGLVRHYGRADSIFLRQQFAHSNRWTDPCGLFKLHHHVIIVSDPLIVDPEADDQSRMLASGHRCRWLYPGSAHYD
jgi:hypothetical protein